MARIAPGCEDEARKVERAEAAKDAAKRGAARDKKKRELEAAEAVLEACQKAREDSAILLLLKASQRVRSDLGMKTRFNWRKITIREEASDRQVKDYTKSYGRKTLAGCVDMINKENEKDGIAFLVAAALAPLTAKFQADALDKGVNVFIWIAAGVALLVIVILAWPAIVAAAAYAASAGAALVAGSLTWSAFVAGAVTAGGAVVTGQTLAALSWAALQYVGSNPQETLSAISKAADAGGDLASKKLRQLERYSESQYTRAIAKVREDSKKFVAEANRQKTEKATQLAALQNAFKSQASSIAAGAAALTEQAKKDQVTFNGKPVKFEAPPEAPDWYEDPRTYLALAAVASVGLLGYLLSTDESLA